MFHALFRMFTALFSGAAELFESAEKLAEAANMAATKVAYDQHLTLCRELDKSQLGAEVITDLKTRLAPRPISKSAAKSELQTTTQTK